jgi:hypothetical protein
MNEVSFRMGGETFCDIHAPSRTCGKVKIDDRAAISTHRPLLDEQNRLVAVMENPGGRRPDPKITEEAITL